MPAVVAVYAAVSGFAATVGFGAFAATAFGVAAAALTVVGYIGMSIAIGMAVGKVAKAIGLGPKLPTGGLTSGSPLQISRSPVDARRVIYGRTRVGGTLVYAQVTGTKNEYVHLVIALAGHECEAIEDIYFNDEVVPVDGSGNATGTFAGNVRVRKWLGSPNQTADLDLVSESGGKWTTNHRMRGIAAVYLRLLYDQSKFPGGIPNISAVVKGRKVYDPRDGVTRWTENNALTTRDYLVNQTFGLQADAATEIDEASVIAAANVCDESVALLAGGTEKRYTCNGCFDLSAEPGTVLEHLCGSMAGFVVYVGGKWILHAGAAQTPSVTFDENDLRGTLSVQTKLSLRDTCNRVRGTYASPEEKWQPTDFPPVIKLVKAPNISAGAVVAITELGTTDFTLIGASSNAVGVVFTATGPGTGTGKVDPYLGEDGGQEIWRDIALPFTTSGSMAQRIARAELERTRQDISATAPCKLTALRARAGSVVEFNNTRHGWNEKPFIVTGLKFSAYSVEGTPALGVDLALRETASTVFDWVPGDDETTIDPAPNTDLPDPWAVAGVTGLALANAGIVQPDGTVEPRLQVTWDAAPNQHILKGGKVRIEHKKHDDSDWTATEIPGDQTSWIIASVAADTAYDVRAIFINNLGVVSNTSGTPVYATVSNFTVAGDTTAPGAPSGVTVTAFAGYNAIKCSESTAPDRAAYLFYRNSSNNGGTATLIGTNAAPFFDDDANTPGATQWYFVAVRDSSGNVGTKSPGVSVVSAADPLTDIVPDVPTAPTISASGTYYGGDGTVYGFLQLSVPAKPSNARKQEIRLRRDITGLPETRAQLTNAITSTLRIDGLATNVAYRLTSLSWSANNASAEVEAVGSPVTIAPPTPSAPTGLTASTTASVLAKATPRFVTLGGAKMLCGRLSWTAPSAKDILFYEVQCGSLFGLPGPEDDTFVRTKGNETEIFVYFGQGIGSVLCEVRAVNRAQNRSPYSSTVTLTPTGSYGTGDMAEQNASGVEVTGIQTGNGSSVRKVVARYPGVHVFTTVGGAATEYTTVNIANRGFGAAPDAAALNIESTVYGIHYDKGLSSSTAAKLKLFLLAGGTIPASNSIGVYFEFVEYD